MKTALKKSTKKQVSKKIAPQKATATLSSVQIEKKLKQLEKFRRKEKLFKSLKESFIEVYEIENGKKSGRTIESVLNEL